MDERSLSILQDRTRRYGAAVESKKIEQSIGAFVGCRIGDMQLGLPSEIVHEFAPLVHWSPFRGRRCLLGITHLRGDVMSLIDLFEALVGKPSGKCAWMAILQGRGGRVAVPVGEILGIRSVQIGEILPPEQSPFASPLIMATTVDLWFLLEEQKLQNVFDGSAIEKNVGQTNGFL